MADSFEKIKNKINKGMVTVSSKTTSTIEKTKIKTRIASVQNDIELMYASLGDLTYKMWINNDHNFGNFDEKCNMIKAKQEELARLNDEIRQVEEKEKQTIEEASAYRVFCSNCGAEYDHPVKFCAKCGNKIGE